ncbi:hypothetical protein ACSQ67_006078 [Phaseolus vulgaris]
MCAAEKDGIMLFGVRLTVSDNNPTSLRKSASMNNLPPYSESPPPHHRNAGYASDDVIHLCRRTRKPGVPWTEEEHRQFLLGLESVGKGDWRGISRNFVKTRTPTQVASHAQKYFLRRHTHNLQRRRSSLFDITTDSVKEDEQTVPSARLKPVLPAPPSLKMDELELNGRSVWLKLRLPEPEEPSPATSEVVSNGNLSGDGDMITVA